MQRREQQRCAASLSGSLNFSGPSYLGVGGGISGYSPIPRFELAEPSPITRGMTPTAKSPAFKGSGWSLARQKRRSRQSCWMRLGVRCWLPWAWGWGVGYHGLGGGGEDSADDANAGSEWADDSESEWEGECSWGWGWEVRQYLRFRIGLIYSQHTHHHQGTNFTLPPPWRQHPIPQNERRHEPPTLRPHICASQDHTLTAAQWRVWWCATVQAAPQSRQVRAW